MCCVYQAYKSAVSFKYQARRETWCVIGGLIWMTGPEEGAIKPQAACGIYATVTVTVVFTAPYNCSTL